MEIVDLSRVIYDGMPKIPVLPDVHVQRCLSLTKGHPLNVTEISLPCHAGTHVDAPVHIVADGKSIEEMPLESFIGPGGLGASINEGFTFVGQSFTSGLTGTFHGINIDVSQYATVM